MVQKSLKQCGKSMQNSSKSVEKVLESSLPLISVIIPVYNVETYLIRCLDSVKSQTYSNLEIILVDDGSTDQSGELCDAEARQDSRIQVIHQPNQGLSAARNAALDIAKGEYITFVDSDDTISTTMIADLYRLCIGNQVKMSICSFFEVYPDGSKKVDFSKNWSSTGLEQVLDTVNCLQSMLLEQGFTVSAWGKLYQCELFATVRYPVGALYEDVGTTYQLVLKCPRVAFTASPRYNYYQNKNSITKQSFSSSKLSLVELTDKMCDTLDEIYPQLQNVTKERRMRARFSILRQVIFIKNPDKSIKDIEKTQIDYLKAHKDYIFKNPCASKQDKIALRALLISKQLFKLGWKIHSR